MTPIDLTTAPTVDDVAAIAGMDNPVLRNLRITQCYAELSAAMRARTGNVADWVHVRDLGIAAGGEHHPW
jgi:hypothetical protein